MSTFAGVRVESGNQDARILNAEPGLQLAVQAAQSGFQLGGIDGRGYLAER